MRAFDPATYDPTFDRSLIQCFFILAIGACVMFSAAVLDRIGRVGAEEVSRCDDRPMTNIPTLRVPFRDNGTTVAFSPGDAP